ncbi:MAG: hypothetical protein LEGION0398_MBIBDBAK_00843 [Legionellaceae bacterium]
MLLVNLATISCIRAESAAFCPSTAKKAFFIAIEILSSSNSVTVPLRRITRNFPGDITEVSSRLGLSSCELLLNFVVISIDCVIASPN